MNFLDSDKESAVKEMNCIVHCTQKARKAFIKGNYKEAARYYYNASRSFEELDRMQLTKQVTEDQWFRIESMRGQQYIDKEIAEMRTKL